MVKLVYTLVLGTSAVRLASSSLALGTNLILDCRNLQFPIIKTNNNIDIK